MYKFSFYWILGSVLLLSEIYAASSIQEGVLFRDSTVVILAGLPGDLDSEMAYTAQTNQILQILNRPQFKPKEVYLCCNLEAIPPIEVDYPVKKLSNKRESFLTLEDTLKSQSVPVYFIVFGHAGFLGETPVFHVPGPRLTPYDLLEVANVCSKSTWFLFFHGSGLFSKSLRNSQRTIVATESDDRTFKDDPISFPFLLDALKQEDDFPKITQRWADKTNRWFQERNLARTEEPTIWTEDHPPQKLIVPAGDSPASANLNSTAAISSAIPEAKKEAEANNHGDDPAWKTIQLIDSSKYPESEAIVLSRKKSCIMGDDQQFSEENEEYIQILKPEGKRWGDFEFKFNPPEENLEILTCEIRTATGKIETLDPDEIHDARSLEGEESEERRKIFSLPHVETGAVIHFRYRRNWKHFPMPHIFQKVELAEEIPILSYHLEVSTPKKTVLHTKLFNWPATDAQVKSTIYGDIYQWDFTNIPEQVEEPLTPVDHAPCLVLSAFPDWEDFQDWYLRAIRNVNQATPEMANLAKEITKDAKTDREKIAMITRYVTHFRYISVPLGINSYRPHAAANVCQNHYGDCKDKANLLNTLLATLGFKTSLVLVPRFTQAYQELPGFAFNHAISQVQLNGETLWIDSTDDVCTFGLLPPGDGGRNVLVVGPGIKQLVALPVPQISDHRYEIEMDLHVPENGERMIPVKSEVLTRGFADYAMRLAQNNLAHRAKNLELLQEVFSTPNGHFELKQQTSTSSDTLEKNFTYQAVGVWHGLILQVPSSSKRLVVLPAWIPREWEIASLPRKNELFLNQGYPMKIIQKWNLSLPSTAREIQLPPSQSHADEVLSWNLIWSKTSETEVSVKLELDLSQTQVSIAQLANFQTSYNLLEDTLRDGLSYQP